MHSKLGLDRCTHGLYSGAAPLSHDTMAFMKSLGLVISEVGYCHRHRHRHRHRHCHRHRHRSCNVCMESHLIPPPPADLWNDGEPKQQRQLLQPSARPWKQVAKVGHDHHHHSDHQHLFILMLFCTQHPGSNKAV